MGTEHSQKGFEECLQFLSQPSRNGQYLLLYDNVDDPSIDLSSLLPQGPWCAITITSRNAILGDLCPDAHLQLDIMSASEAVELLLYSSSSSAVITDQARKDALTIAQELGYLPIALQQAHSYMRQTKCSATEYLGSLSSNRHGLLGRLTKHQLNMASISTYAAFETSFEELDTYVQKFLRVVSHFHWSNFPFELVVLAAEQLFFDYEMTHMRSDGSHSIEKNILKQIFFQDWRLDVQLLDNLSLQLQSYSLATVTSGTGTRLLHLHPLVHEWVRSCIPKDERHEYQSTAVSLLAHGGRKDYTVIMQYLASHVNHMSHLWDQLHVNSMVAFSCILHKNGVLQGALQLQKMVVKEFAGASDEQTAASNFWKQYQVSIYCDLGKLEEAKALQEGVLKLNEERYGKYNDKTLLASSTLAIVYRHLARLNDAKELLEEAVRLWKKKHSEWCNKSLPILANLALVYYDLGRLEEARILQEEVLKLREKVDGKPHPNTVSASNNLAATYVELGQLEEARALQERVMELRKEMHGERHPSTIKALNNLAVTYYDLGRLEEARLLQEQALDLMAKTQGSNHHITTKISFLLVEIYVRLGRMDAAFTLLGTIEGVISETLGVTHQQYLEFEKIKAMVLTFDVDFPLSEASEHDVTRSRSPPPVLAAPQVTDDIAGPPRKKRRYI